MVVKYQANKGQSTEDAIFEAQALLGHVCTQLIAVHPRDITVVDIERFLVSIEGKEGESLTLSL
jgi:hypothetical protein